MRFLSVAARELRSTARHKATYRVRWVTAAIFLGLLVWLLWAFGGFTNQRAVPSIFRTYSVLTLLYCLFMSTARTADCISVERREGTLGLLFLTNLNSGEIILGKLCSSALASVFGLMAIFPMLALPLLMGGITFGNFGRTVLALLSGILSGLAAGFLASVLCKRQFTAIGLALGLTIFLGGGLLLGGALANHYAPTKPWPYFLAGFSPLQTLMAADTMRGGGPNVFWHSTAAVTGLSLGCLGLTTFLLSRIWRDRPKRDRAWHRVRFWRRSEQSLSTGRAALSRRLLSINPILWLAAPNRVSAPVFMVIAIALTTLTVYGTAPYFGRVLPVPAGTVRPVLGQLVAWLCTGLAIHALVLYYAATTASQRLAEDKQTGALELILSTPTDERAISRGLWLAYARKMTFPALMAVLVHIFFIWQVMVMAILDPPSTLAPGVTPGGLFLSALLKQPIGGRVLAWQVGFMVHLTLLVLLLFIVTWPTLAWVGRWLGLRMKHPALAPMASLALLLVPPVLLFSLCCYLAGKFQFYHLPERRIFPTMLWLAFSIGIGHCIALSLWAATRLRHNLRAVALSRYQPLPAWRWRIPTRRTFRRLAVVSASLAAVSTFLILSYYGYQNWRGKRLWRTFQTSLKQNREPITVSELLPEPAPAEANLARSPAFLVFLSQTNREATELFGRLRAFDLPTGSGGSVVFMDWSSQTQSSLHPFVKWTPQRTASHSNTNRVEDAEVILRGLESQDASLRALAAAADRLAFFQTWSNRDASAVLRPAREPILLLERLQLLFEVRAGASLALGRTQAADEDMLAGLRLAQLARQLPDAGSTLRVQGLLVRSLQPLWEGLSQQAWSEPQLAAFQHQLATFNLLADYTNAIRRVVLANIDVWRGIPDGANPHAALPVADGGYLHNPAWQFQPRTWWYDSCIELHYAGQNAIDAVDLAASRIRPPNNFSDLNGLPLDSSCSDLLQQWSWWVPNPGSVAFTQTRVNQAIIACALERFRLATGAYPENLQQLVPTLLDRIPHDAVSGRPMIFEPGNSTFVLRGVGPNGVDDRKNTSSDDWLWTYSTNTPSAKK